MAITHIDVGPCEIKLYLDGAYGPFATFWRTSRLSWYLNGTSGNGLEVTFLGNFTGNEEEPDWKVVFARSWNQCSATVIGKNMTMQFDVTPEAMETLMAQYP